MDDVEVLIRKDANDAGTCFAEPDPFKARLGDNVIFQFPGEPKGVKIKFRGATPFDVDEFDLDEDPQSQGVGFAKKKVSTSPEKVKKNYNYLIRWTGNGGGSGNGSGDVGPSR